MVSGIERRGERPRPWRTRGESREGYGRSEGEHFEGQRNGAHDRARSARLSYGGSRGPEALWVLRRTRLRWDQRLHGDARYAPRTSLGLSCGTLGVRGRRAHGFGVPQPPGSARGHRVHVDGHEKGPLGQADLGYRGRCRASRAKHRHIDGADDPRARQVLPRSAPGDTSTALGGAGRSRRGHTRPALLRAWCRGGTRSGRGRHARGGARGGGPRRAGRTIIAVVYLWQAGAEPGELL